MADDITTIADLHIDERNARKRGLRASGMLEASLQEVGAARSIVIDEAGNILAGNGTVEAAGQVGIERVQVVDADGETLVAVRRTGLTKAQKKRLALLDNRTAELAEWEPEVLAELAQQGVKLDDLWATDELDALLAGLQQQGGLLPDADPDEIPQDAPTRCESGDLWRLGEHRVLCGDSTKREDVDRLMGGERVALCLTDPPYGVGWDYASTDDTQSNLVSVIAGFLPLAREVANVVMLTPGNPNTTLYPKPIWTLAWFVPAGSGSGPWGFTCWQPVLAYGKDPYLQAAMGRRPDALCLTESAPDVNHPCPKPVGVWKWLLERGSVKKTDIVYDPFLGSGTTLIAAEQLGRRCYGIEIEPRYCDVILARWEQATGRTAELVEHGTPTQGD